MFENFELWESLILGLLVDVITTEPFGIYPDKCKKTGALDLDHQDQIGLQTETISVKINYF